MVNIGNGARPGEPESTAGLPANPGKTELALKLSGKTSAVLVDKQEFLERKSSEGLHVVGVTGFSGQWDSSKVAADPALQADVAAATVMIHQLLMRLREKFGSKLVISTGATMPGVPGLFYEACEHMGIAAMGVACEKAADYTLGKMQYLIIEGADWGSESPTFLETSDEIVMIGGGGQAKREAIAAGASGKSVTVFQGFKGTADSLTAADLPGAVFVKR